MHGNRSFAALSGIAAVMFGLYATMTVLLSEGNTVGEFCRYLLAAGFLVSLLQPRLGFFLWLFACGYSDLLKRFLVIGGRMSWSDLPYVLGIAPMMFGGVLVSVLIGAMFGVRTVRPMHWKLFMWGILLMGVTAVTTYLGETHSLNAVLQALANSGLYSMLLFVVAVLFDDVDDFLGMIRCLIWMFIPVALYGVTQQAWGFQDFEIAYLKTGMSIEIKQLFGDRIRAFSTLNSPTSFATVCASLGAMCLLLSSRHALRGQRRLFGRFTALLLAGVFLAGWLASTGRAALIIVPFALFATWAFQDRGRTTLAYAMVIVTFVGLVLSSGYILGNLDAVNRSIVESTEGSGYGSAMLSVGTYSDRLMGFNQVLANPKAWSWFGKANPGSEFYFHDPLSPVLLKLGGVGFFAVIGIAALLLRWAHRRLYEVNDTRMRWLACMFLAVAMGIVLASLLSGWILSVFPINVLFWLCWSGVVLVVLQDADAVSTEPLPEAPAAGLPAAAPRRRLPINKSIPLIAR